MATIVPEKAWGEISGHNPSFPSCCPALFSVICGANNRNLIRERTRAGLAAARARGKKGGRRHALDETRRQRLYKLYDETNPDGSKKYAVKEICEMMKISKSTLYAYLGQR